MKRVWFWNFIFKQTTTKQLKNNHHQQQNPQTPKTVLRKTQAKQKKAPPCHCECIFNYLENMAPSCGGKDQGNQ